jgi:hypothetical protein
MVIRVTMNLSWNYPERISLGEGGNSVPISRQNAPHPAGSLAPNRKGTQFRLRVWTKALPATT